MLTLAFLLICESIVIEEGEEEEREREWEEERERRSIGPGARAPTWGNTEASKEKSQRKKDLDNVRSRIRTGSL